MGAQWGWAGQLGSLCPMLNLSFVFLLVGEREEESEQAFFLPLQTL